MEKCDICDYEGEDVIAGRWIFYCPKHKDKDWEMTYENEIKPDIENKEGDMRYILNDGELQEMILRNL